MNRYILKLSIIINKFGGFYMKKYLGFITGFLCASLLFTAIPIKAAVQEYILQKADYQVVANGTVLEDSEHPILSYNDTTYLSMRKAAEALGADVTWDSESNKAIISKKSPSGVVQPPPIVFKKTDDGIDITDYEGKEYIGFLLINDKIKSLGYTITFEYNPKRLVLKDKNTTILLNNIEYININGRDSIPVTYYKSTILPLIK